MKLGIMGISFGPEARVPLELIQRAEALGFDSAWTAEAYGNDAVTTATWILAQTTKIRVGTAIMQMPREYIRIIRAIMAREEPLEFHGTHYDIPATGAGTTGLGKPLKSILHGNPELPIYTASISPNGLRCAAEVADGVFPMMMNPERFDELQRPHLEEGFARSERGRRACRSR
jgi:alkanesulfonate monooxygenase SsuD/methylene tetrahydromethanopterin reductase-like flavin-dependent oxidoreductase (luciferase family)